MATEMARPPDLAVFFRELENSSSSSQTTSSPMSDFYQWALARQRNRFGSAAANLSAFFPAAKASVSLTKTSAVLLCDLLGAMCLFLNLFVLFALIRNRKRVLQNVFYVIVLHCAFVDIIRGTCLIIWGIPHLLIYNVPTMEYRLLALKINQIVLIILRSCNLLTIFNLLVFTTNEFIVIKYPLHYRRYFRRQTVVIMLFCSWIISLTFGVGSVFSNFFESSHSVVVLANKNGTKTFSEGGHVVTRRREQDSVSVNMLSMIMIFALCYLCLFVVLVCYGVILRTIRRFHSLDSKGLFSNDESQRIRSTKKFHPEKESTNGTLKANGDGDRCNSHRRWKNHLMSRHKYLIVIGSVLFVDVLFLFPYSGIQMVAFLHLNNFMTTSTSSTIIRWGLQILIGIHSVIQPLCYFRMTEFRRLALCRKRRNVGNRSQSFSHMQRSYGHMKEQPLHTVNEDDVGRKEPNLDDGSGENDALLRRTSFDQMFLSRNWKRVESVKFRTYGDNRRSSSPKKKISSLRSSTCYELESLFIADEAEQPQIPREALE